MEHAELSRKTKPELVELLKRQDRLLKNKKFIARLPDSGGKLRNLKRYIEKRLDELQSVDVTVKLVQGLTIGNLVALGSDDDNDDSNIFSDDDDNVFKILASNGRTKKIIINDSTIPTESQLQSSENKPEDPFIDVLTRKLEEKQISASHQHERLKLNRSVTGDTKQDHLNAKYFVDGVWIETGVTPPPSKFTEAKVITFEESYQLQKEQADKQSKLKVVLAASHLAERMNLCRIDCESTSDFIHGEGESADEGSHSHSSEELVEVHDDN